MNTEFHTTMNVTKDNAWLLDYVNHEVMQCKFAKKKVPVLIISALGSN